MNLGNIGTRLIASLISDAAFIGGLTILGYLITYSYLTSRAETLGVPEMLVSVSAETCLFVIFALVISSLFLVTVVNVAIGAIPKRLHRSVLIQNGALPLSLMVAVIIAASLSVTPMLFGLLIIPILLAACLAIVPFFEPKDGRNYFQRLNDKLEANAKIAPDSKPFEWLGSHTGVKIMWLMLVPFIGIWVGHELGKADAEFTTRYFVTSAKPPEVLLSHYGDILVFRQIGSPTITIKVIGKDEIAPLVTMQTGSMAIVHQP